MPTYFFTIVADGRSTPDRHGKNLPDDGAACVPARCLPGDIFRLGQHRLICNDQLPSEDGSDQPFATSGFVHLSLENREKSRSVVQRVAPCSIASAARCASGTRLPPACPFLSRRSRISG